MGKPAEGNRNEVGTSIISLYVGFIDYEMGETLKKMNHDFDIRTRTQNGS